MSLNSVIESRPNHATNTANDSTAMIFSARSPDETMSGWDAWAVGQKYLINQVSSEEE